MDAPAQDPQDESIGDLVNRLIEDGRDYARAEFELYGAIANYRAIRARRALVALAAGWFFLVTSMTALVLGTVLSLAARIGAMWAGLAVGIPLAAGGYALVRYGWRGVKSLTEDEAERQALRRGESA